MKHTATHCHCGADRQGSDHCPECGCEEFESVCDHVAERKLFNRGNLFTGDPYGVEVIGYFGSSELHDRSPRRTRPGTTAWRSH